MKKFFVCTIFPSIINNYIQHSIPKIAQQKKLVEINTIDVRLYASNKYKQVDDYQYGGGAGMVLMVEPFVHAIKNINSQNKYIILLSPRGNKLDQKKLIQLINLNKDLVFLCGHYEGIDERINNWVDEYLSIGDYVLSSGELAALVILDGLIRIIPGVINVESLTSESFNNFLLDYPVYTKPRIIETYAVPEILFSGHHANIAAFRLKQKIALTKKFRPDLYKQYLKKT